MPDSYREGVIVLGRLGVLSEEFAERIAGMAGFRNILVHDYLDVDLGIVKQLLDERLDDFRKFGQQVQDHVARVG